jgi:hypothetical protein
LLPKITPVRAKEENIEQLFKLADQFCEKIKPGTLHGNSKTIISMELGEFLRFAKREIEKNKKLPVLYMVAVDKNSLDRKDQRVDGYLGFGNEVMKICLYGRGQAIKKARIFKGKIVRFNGKPNRRKHYLV